MYLLMIYFILGLFLYLLTILLIGSGSFNDSNESGHLDNPRNDVMDSKCLLNFRTTSISFKIRPYLSESIMFPKVLIPFFEK